MTCSNCGQPNESGNELCAACAALHAGAAQPEPASEVNERYLQLVEAAHKVTNGEWTSDEYVAFLDQVAGMLADKEAAVRDLEIPPEAFEDFRSEIEAGFTGIQLFNEGIAHMRGGVEDGNPAHLEDGLELVRQGSEALNEAMRINRENQRRVQEILFSGSARI